MKIVIPARYQSSRLPGKPLLDIAGKPMIQHVYENARHVADGDNLLVATDDRRILDCVESFGGRALMTASDHASGTDRIAEIAARLDWPDDEIVVNLQGDEPLLGSETIRQVIAVLDQREAADIATLVHPIKSSRTWLDSHVVKAVIGVDMRALYFSRAPIPHHPAGDVGDIDIPVFQHIGLYAYRVGQLLRLSGLPKSGLESAERLEQLRALENGMQIYVDIARQAPTIGVDTPADLAQVRSRISNGVS